MSISICAILSLVFFICGSVSTAEAYQNDAGAGLVCPVGYELIGNLCYNKNRCEEGYFLHTDGMCYLLKPKPCPIETTTSQVEELTTTTEEITTTTEEITTTTPEPTTTTEEPTTTTEEPTTTTATEEPTTTTTEEPTTTTTTEEPIIVEPDEQVRCPPGSIYLNEQCRKIICTQGEYYQGRCLSSACPVGTVWRNKRCQSPGYITTILEIDNVVKNHFKHQAVTENIQRVEYETLKPYDPSVDINYDTTMAPITVLTTKTTPPPEKITEEAYPGEIPPDGCCLVRSPRFCRPYPPTWVCINRSHKLCDRRICTRPYIYLKPPQAVQLTDPPMLVMPPNPPLWACSTPECLKSGVLNCSGCVLEDRETCSAGCYNYYCPEDSCQLKKSEDFCALYPGGFGCRQRDGCIWDWCTEKCR
ncbi:hypothetical protein ACLKA7_010186 [Drosophila subpalustris]